MYRSRSVAWPAIALVIANFSIASPTSANDKPDLDAIAARWKAQREQPEIHAIIEFRWILLGRSGLKDRSFENARRAEEYFFSPDFDLRELCDLLLDQGQFPYAEPWGIRRVEYWGRSRREERKMPYRNGDEIASIMIYNHHTKEFIHQNFLPYRQVTLQRQESSIGVIAMNRLRLVPGIKSLAAAKVVARDADQNTVSVAIPLAEGEGEYRLTIEEETGFVRRMESPWPSGSLRKIRLQGPPIHSNGDWIPSRFMILDFNQDGISSLQISEVLDAQLNCNTEPRLTSISPAGVKIFDHRNGPQQRMVHIPKTAVLLPSLTPVLE